MVKKKIASLLCALMITSTSTSLLNSNVNTIVAEAATIIEGVKTSTGVITSKVVLKDTFPTDSSKITIDYLKSISKSVNPTDNPEMFNIIVKNYNWATHLNYLTDNIYYYGREFNHNATDEKVYMDDFYKILSLKKADKENYVTVTFAQIEFIDGELFMDSRNSTQTYENAKVYNYLVEEENKVETPSEANKPSTPSTPTTLGNTDKPSNGDSSNNSSNSESTKKYTSNRLGGSDRYATSIAIAKEFNKSSFTNVIIASGTDFPDSLSASALSKKLNAPILLVNKNSTNSKETINYIKNNMSKDGKVYLLGGSGVVSDDIVSSLKSYGFKNFKRLGGSDRFQTNISINKELNVEKGSPVIIASGLDFADALSISSISGIKNIPIYLSKKDSIDNNTLSEIKSISPSKIYIVGGTGAVSSSVEKTLKGISTNITRLGGKDRYETSMAITKHFNLDTNTIAIANGLTFPDALSGSALASKNNAPILLVNNDVSKQKLYLDSTKINKIYVLGGSGVINDKVVYNLKN